MTPYNYKAQGEDPGCSYPKGLKLVTCLQTQVVVAMCHQLHPHIKRVPRCLQITIRLCWVQESQVCSMVTVFVSWLV